MTKLRTLATLLVLAGGLAQPVAAQDATRATPSPSDQLLELENRIQRLTTLHETAKGEDQEVFYDQLARRWFEHHELLNRIAADLARDTEKAAADSVAFAQARASLAKEIAFLKQRVKIRIDDLAKLLVERASAPRESWFAMEEKMADLSTLVDRMMYAIASDYKSAETLRMDVATERAEFDELMANRASLQAARIEAGRQELVRLQQRLSRPGAQTEALEMERAAVKERIRWNSASLEILVESMQNRRVDTTAYQAILLETTGQLGKGALDPKVLGTLVQKWIAKAAYWLRLNASKILVRVLAVALVLVAAWATAYATRRVIRRTLGSKRLSASKLLQELLIGTASRVVWILGFIVVLSMVGIDIGPMLAGLGIAGFILGFALQETLSNFASGLMIMMYRPFDVGDVVTAAGVTGKVDGLTIVSTVITTFDNQRIVVPNSKVWGNVITNATAETVRRVDLVFGIGYQEDIDKARRILEDIISAHPLVLKDPEPVVRLNKLGESSVDFVCRPWCKTVDYWTVYWDVTQQVKKRFDAEGVSIPFPQRDVHVYQHAASPR